MKRLIVSSLSVLLLTVVIAPITSAQTVTINSETLYSHNSYHLSPFDLVSLAYQGGFNQQGIPSAGALKFAYEYRQISAETLVKSAVTANLLSPSALNDRRYLSAVSNQLDRLTRGK